MGKKGMSFIFIIFIMSIIFTIIVAILKMGLNDIYLAKTFNEMSKSYSVAESGAYYGQYIVITARNKTPKQNPEGVYTVNNPFSEYRYAHGFVITVDKHGSDYWISSVGTYNGRTNKVNARCEESRGFATLTYMQKVQ